MTEIISQIKEISDLIELFLSWKRISLSFIIAIVTLILDYFPWFHAKIGNMFNYIQSIAGITLYVSIIAISFKSFDFVFSKMEAKLNQRKKEKLQQIYDANIFASLQFLSEPEIKILKYLLSRNSFTAWIPADNIGAILLHKKKYIECLSEGRTNMDIISLDVNLSDKLYAVSEKIIQIVKKYDKQLELFWKTVQTDQNLNKYQNKYQI